MPAAHSQSSANVASPMPARVNTERRLGQAGHGRLLNPCVRQNAAVLCLAATTQTCPDPVCVIEAADRCLPLVHVKT